MSGSSEAPSPRFKTFTIDDITTTWINLGLASAAGQPISAFDTAGAAAAEMTRAEGAETTIMTAITTERNRAEATENLITSALIQETTRAVSAEVLLSTAITNESSRAIAAEATLMPLSLASSFTTPDGMSYAVAAETARAEGAEASLLIDINNETTRATGAESTLTIAISNEISRAFTAEGVLAAAIVTERDRAEAAEALITLTFSTPDGVALAVAAETTRATGAESTLSSSLSTETLRAEIAEASLSTTIANEVTRAEGAETTLLAAITTERDRAEAAEALFMLSSSSSSFATPTDVATAVGTETSRAETAEAAIRTDLCPIAGPIYSTGSTIASLTLGSGFVYSSGTVTITGVEHTTNKGIASGYAGLDSGGRVPFSQLPASLGEALVWTGTWNASTNSPTLTSSVGTGGSVYTVTTAGTTTLNGIAVWNIGDKAVFNGITGSWEKIDGLAVEVVSVAGRTGNVVLSAGDISGLATIATTGAYTDLSGTPTLGGAASLNVGTTTGSVAAGDDIRITGALSATTAASTYQPLLGFTPYNSTNPAGYQTAANVATAVGVETTRAEAAEALLSAALTSGTVNNIATGAGLVGGPITTSGTISLNTIAATTLFGNLGTASAVPSAISIGNGFNITGSTISAQKQGTITLSGTTTGTVTPTGLTSCLVNVGTSNGTISIGPGFIDQPLRLHIKQGSTAHLVAFDTTVVFGVDITTFTATASASARDMVQLFCLDGTHWGFGAVNHGFAI